MAAFTGVLALDLPDRRVDRADELEAVGMGHQQALDQAGRDRQRLALGGFGVVAVAGVWIRRRLAAGASAVLHHLHQLLAEQRALTCRASHLIRRLRGRAGVNDALHAGRAVDRADHAGAAGRRGRRSRCRRSFPARRNSCRPRFDLWRTVIAAVVSTPVSPILPVTWIDSAGPAIIWPTARGTRRTVASRFAAEAGLERWSRRDGRVGDREPAGQQVDAADPGRGLAEGDRSSRKRVHMPSMTKRLFVLRRRDDASRRRRGSRPAASPPARADRRRCRRSRAGRAARSASRCTASAWPTTPARSYPATALAMPCLFANAWAVPCSRGRRPSPTPGHRGQSRYELGGDITRSENRPANAHRIAR